MAKKPNPRVILPSLIDRLIDREPKNSKETAEARAQSLLELKDSVRRDLEWLLNSRRCIDEVGPPPSAKELAKSVYAYGLPDMTGVALASAKARKALVEDVKLAVATFEPRLLNVEVSLKPSASDSHVLRFQIEALLRTEPAPARVSFDTTLELSKGEYAVSGDMRAR